MTNLMGSAALQQSVLGNVVSKAYSPLVVETKTLFNVSGLVLVTGIVGKVTTAITVANTVKLQANPTTGTTSDLCLATDLGTTDTPAGNLLSISGAPTAGVVSGIGAVGKFPIAVVTNSLGAVDGVYVAAGTIEQVTATGADGGITWFLSYVPIETNAAITAA